MCVLFRGRPAAVAAFVGCLLGAAMAIAPAGAQTRRPMSLIDLAELPRVADPQISSDGRFVTYLLSHADWTASRAVWNLWRQDVSGGAPRQLTMGSPGEGFGNIISPDGTTIAMVRGGQIFLIPATGGEARALTHHATGVFSPSWTP